eukprot:GHRQ01023211.1.p1 GENE.GHRQ01023211.1~~GHRQ01023211.1.p1  ORF type:complete len:122 (+),score=24.09 GHRQ01023211.1:650-1015(+)
MSLMRLLEAPLLELGCCALLVLMQCEESDVSMLRRYSSRVMVVTVLAMAQSTPQLGTIAYHSVKVASGTQGVTALSSLADGGSHAGMHCHLNHSVYHVVHCRLTYPATHCLLHKSMLTQLH